VLVLPLRQRARNRILAPIAALFKALILLSFLQHYVAIIATLRNTVVIIATEHAL
jgi:hypothetical protein